MSTDVAVALDHLVTAYMRRYQEHHGKLPLADFDPDWPSPCIEQQTPDGDQVLWQPVRQQEPPKVFAGLEAAFEQPLHEDIKTYYGRYWSDHLPMSSPHGDLDLLMIWNEDDFERLRENLVGHALVKFKKKQPLTLFFACPVSQEDLFISLDTQTGAILLEKPGHKPLRTLAANLAEFLTSLSPRVD